MAREHWLERMESLLRSTREQVDHWVTAVARNPNMERLKIDAAFWAHEGDRLLDKLGVRQVPGTEGSVSHVVSGAIDRLAQLVAVLAPSAAGQEAMGQLPHEPLPRAPAHGGGHDDEVASAVVRAPWNTPEPAAQKKAKGKDKSKARKAEARKSEARADSKGEGKRKDRPKDKVKEKAKKKEKAGKTGKSEKAGKDGKAGGGDESA
jgi:hypothetical protein